METYQECHDEWTGRYRKVHHDAEYRLVLENDEGDTGKVRVDKSVYDDYAVGDFYDKEME